VTDVEMKLGSSRTLKLSMTNSSALKISQVLDEHKQCFSPSYVMTNTYDDIHLQRPPKLGGFEIKLATTIKG
jgi:hypothetical protein